jgi:predicted DNA-binding transcriptional regulator YafY
VTEQTRRASRLLEIERLIRRRPGGMTAVELAQELGRSNRTIQRDINVLESELGTPLVMNGRRYQILPESAPLAPVRLTLHEARAILLATRLFLRHADEWDPDGISALEKIADSLPEPVARRVTATVEQLKTRPMNPLQNAVLRTITEGWANSRTVAIRYRSQHGKPEKVTALDPYLLEPSTTGAATYVIGYSHMHGAVRTFKIDRILKAEASSESFVPRDLPEIEARLATSWGVVFDGEEEYDVCVEFSPAVAQRVSETNWHPSQRLTPCPDGGVQLDVRLPSLMEFIPWVRSWGREAVVISPAHLRAQLAEEFRAAAERYEAG